MSRLKSDEIDYFQFALRGGRAIHFERMLDWMDRLPEFYGSQDAAVGLVRCLIRL